MHFYTQLHTHMHFHIHTYNITKFACIFRLHFVFLLYDFAFVGGGNSAGDRQASATTQRAKISALFLVLQ